jgi:phosphatidate cytidylyltransferase
MSITEDTMTTHNPAQQLSAAKRPKDLFKRVVTAVIGAPLILWLFVSQTAYVAYFLNALTFLLVGEWAYMVFQLRKSEAQKLYWLGLGTLYIVTAMYSFYDLYLYSMPLAITLLLATWASDSAAYFTGRRLGGPKLAPRISPNKTWSGTIGGLVGALIVAALSCLFLKGTVTFNYAGLFIIIVAVGQVGDLLESAVKRYFNLKDSSNIIPGHGGILDRMDSLLLSSLFIYGLKLLVGYGALFRLS